MKNGWKNRYSKRFNGKRCRGGATLQGLISKVFGTVQSLSTAIGLGLRGVDCNDKINYNSSMKNYNKRKRAFTLAEVLITLGIIGVVAALTIPTLISNYNKRQTVTKLKQTYSILSQALTMAQVKEGDPSTWEVAGIYGTPTDDPNFNVEDVITKFATKYLIPYIKVTKDYGYTLLSRINYEGFYTPASGVLSDNSGVIGYIILLSNNVLIRNGLESVCADRNDDGTCRSREYRNISFLVDINGFSKPNTIGKDIFYMRFNISDKQFKFHNYGGSRLSTLNSCKTDSGSQICGQLIYLDGWEIKDDYPWF